MHHLTTSIYSTENTLQYRYLKSQYITLNIIKYIILVFKPIHIIYNLKSGRGRFRPYCINPNYICTG